MMCEDEKDSRINHAENLSQTEHFCAWPCSTDRPKIVQQPWLLHKLIHKLNKLKAWKLWNSLKAFVTLCCLSSWSRAWHADSDEFTSQMIGDSKQLLDHPSAFTSSECGDPRLEMCFVDCSKLRLLAPMKLWQRLPQRMSMIFTWYVLYFSPILARSWLLGWRGLNMLEHVWMFEQQCLTVRLDKFWSIARHTRGSNHVCVIGYRLFHGWRPPLAHCSFPCASNRCQRPRAFGRGTAQWSQALAWHHIQWSSMIYRNPSQCLLCR